MKELLLFVFFLILSNLSAQEWFDNNGSSIEVLPTHTSKDSTWERYCTAPAWAWSTTEERAVYFNANDFGLEYPVNLHAVTSYLDDAGYIFNFKIYHNDGTTILNQKRLTSVNDRLNDYYIATPLVLTDNFWIAVTSDANGLPTQVLSDVVSKTNSYQGMAGDWELYESGGDLYEFIILALLSPYTGPDIYPPSVRNITGTSTYKDIDASIGLFLQDQNSVVSPIVGEYSLDGGTTWLSFNLISAKDTQIFSGIIPGQSDGTNGIVRFNLEDDQGNVAVSDNYQIEWSKNNPLFVDDFEEDPFGLKKWSMQTTGAGWIYSESIVIDPIPHSGKSMMAHYDDVGTQDDWLITPTITLPSTGNILLSFWETSKWVEFIDTHEVSITTDGGATWEQLISTVPEEGIFNQVYCSLSDYVGQNIKLGWHYIGDYNDQWFIDDIEIFVDDVGPSLNKIYADENVLPVIGTFVNNDMAISLEIFDKTYIQSTVGHYSFDGGITYTVVDFNQVKGDEVWQAIIPALDSNAVGTIYFEITNLSEFTLTTENYTIEFISDTWNPILQEVLGTTAQVNNDASISLLISDQSGIASCLGYYSNDNFVTQTEITFIQFKSLENRFLGIIPAETEIIEGEIKFTIEDNGGNVIDSEIYRVEWINELPVDFDLRTSLSENYVSSVKTQINGTCWCFGACSAIESNLMMTGIWDAVGETGEPNLSEYHLDWWNGFNQFYNGDIDPPTGDGLQLHLRGDYLITAAYMTRGEGVVRDIDVPSIYVEPERFSDSYHYFYARDIEFYTMDDQLNGLDLIKQKIKENGAMATSLTYTYDFMSIDDYFHYQPLSDPIFYTHAVSIVGWDDNKTSTYHTPPAPGAWLCKNEFGTDWGNDGYFWVSYFDKFVAREPEGGAVSFQNVEPKKYDNIYYHDYHGWSDTMTETNEAFNAFTSLKEEDLVAVSFYTAKDNVDFTIIVYDDFDGVDLQSILSTTSGHIDYKGFHTIDLPSIVTIPPSDDFYIYLFLSSGGQPYDQSSYIPSAWLTYQSSASPGESFYMSGSSWLDLYDNISISHPQTANFCIKGLCDDDTGIETSEIRIQNFELEQNYPNPFNPNTTINFLVPKNNSNIKLLVYNVKGELISTLFDGVKSIGRHSIDFNASSLNSGIYFYSLEIDGIKQSTKKMVMIK